MTAKTLLERVSSIAAGSPFRLEAAPEPFTFDRVPQGVIGSSYRVECYTTAVRAGLSYSEERFDDLVCWVASPTNGDPTRTYRTLEVLANSLTSAIVRDGCGDGDFGVPDGGRAVRIEADPTASYQVLRLTVPVSYMLTI